MTIEDTVSSNFDPCSSIVKSVFDCRISGVWMNFDFFQQSTFKAEGDTHSLIITYYILFLFVLKFNHLLGSCFYKILINGFHFIAAI